MPVLICQNNLSMSIQITQKRSFCAISPKKTQLLGRQNKSGYRSASLTAEAAFAFPIFFFSVFMLWQLFLLLLFQMDVCNKVTSAAMEYAHLGYPERKAEEEKVDISWLYLPIMWNAVPEDKRMEDLFVVCLPQEDGSIQTEVSYQFVFQSVFFTDISFPVKQSFRFYPYIGETDEDCLGIKETEDVVYMTEYGTVYHESRACGYLTVTVREVSYASVAQERNSAGGKYTECERCGKAGISDKVYISAGGSRYHSSTNCSALKRTITEKTRDEVTGIPACHKCGQKQEETK